MDNLKGMAVFATVVARGSMAAAAESLGMTPSAVSQQIRKLEAHAQVTLLHRTTRKLTLTEAGEAFYRSCAQMLAIAEEAEQRLGEWREAPVGELRLAAPVGFSGQLISEALRPLLENHRQLRLQLFFHDEQIDLIEQRIDLAIRVGSLSDSSLVARHLAEWNNIICAAPAYLRRLPLDVLKVDRSFIQDVPGSQKDREIVQAIIIMAHTLHLQVVTEGVETIEQHAFLAAHGCDFLQGYLLSRPVPLAELRPILERLDAREPALSPCCDTALPVSPDLFADTPGYRASASVAQPGH